ncbi:hypothetical protein ACXZ1K_05150 [Pedobacter sp. PWIIR3]
MNQNSTMTTATATYAFTQSGVDALLQELYQLPKFELKAESETLKTNFREWLSDRFELKPSQLDYLNNMNAQTLKLTAASCSFALANQLPIYVEKPANESKDDDPPKLKEIMVSTNLKSKSANDGKWGAFGHVTVCIGYRD